ncbi:hypothetical protein [Chryseobacterium oryzae]|uniref:VCBS repeat-containing protein n=1 Tax=Chryseobacterium oryzae TaxID=2929799 RepID=A0ABY4BGT8_9FLAO|nr:hypothetical protein [Chryseobacterium oryzae]UOE38393.1 hypothetical protein MTP08_01050 [Chryseobacterium oryzae]
MKLQFVISLLLVVLLDGSIIAQKNQNKIKLKTKSSIVKSKITVPDDFDSILKLLKEGKITLYDACNEQVKVINTIQKSVFAKKYAWRRNDERHIVTLEPVDESVIINLHDKSISYIISTKENINGNMILKEINPRILLKMIKGGRSIDLYDFNEDGQEDIDFIHINLPHGSERVIIDDKGYILEKKDNYLTTSFFYPVNDLEAKRRLINSLKNIVLLINCDVEDFENKIELPKIITKEYNKGTRITFELQD